MRFVIFCHSLISDWNHGNAHFLRGVASELLARRHEVRVYEPRDGWSVTNLLRDAGTGALDEFRKAYPQLDSVRYDPVSLDLDAALADADVVLVHEWNEPALVARIGAHRARQGSYRLFFHDTHHRSLTQPNEMAAYELGSYDGVLAFGRVIAEAYRSRGWTRCAWTWHEAADVRVFHPRPPSGRDGDLIWIGNWGDDERTAELNEFLIQPGRQLQLRAAVHGVRYPAEARLALEDSGIEYRGWLPNHLVPDTFARYSLTVHIPRGPYARAVPGIPTIRVFEALACGIPLVSAPWSDTENLFTPGEDFLVAGNGEEMRVALRALLNDPGRSEALAAHGLSTVRERHTCRHRVDELLAVVRELDAGGPSGVRAA
ncbi:MAG TPA: glycosyltransferase [Gemmatimonadaceae bacterium]|nr:glycosyltransferase [Gemmatimonadaceae bacterium]